MTLVARMISERDIENVAAWYTELKIALSGNLATADDRLAPGARASKAKAGQICQHCNGLDGQAIAGASSSPIPNLSGQPGPFIAEGLEAYRSGSIDHPQMTSIAKSLTNADIANLADW